MFQACLGLHLHFLEKEQRRQWHPTPVLLPRKSHGRRSLVGCSPWGHQSRTRLSDFTFTFHFHALEKEMATHSSVLAWRIPGTGSLVGCHLWGRTESDTTEATQQRRKLKPRERNVSSMAVSSYLLSLSSVFLCLQGTHFWPSSVSNSRLCIINNLLSAQRLKKLCFFLFFSSKSRTDLYYIAWQGGKSFQSILCFLTFFLMTLIIRNDIHSKVYLLVESKIRTLTLCPVHNCGN